MSVGSARCANAAWRRLHTSSAVAPRCCQHALLQRPARLSHSVIRSSQRGIHINASTNNDHANTAITTRYQWQPTDPSPLLSSIVASLATGGLTLADTVKVRGWVRSVRVSKNIAFVMVNDGSCIDSLQAVITREESKAISNGACVEFCGKLVRIERQPPSTASTSTAPVPASTQPQSLTDIEMQVDAVQLIGDSPLSYPIAKKSLTLEYLRDHTHLRFRTNTLGATTRVRSVCHSAIHDWFRANGFWQCHTPVITPLDCEGGGEAFAITSPSDKPNKLFFDRAAYLGVSGQLYAEMLALSLSRVYTFGPIFRAETSQTPRHLAEFWMVEPELTFVSLSELTTISELLIKHCIEALLTHCRADLAFLDRQYNHGALIDRLQSLLSQQWQRMTYTDAVEALSNSGENFEFPVQWGESLHSEHEKWLAEVHCRCPVFVTNYPRAIKPFYMRVDDSSDSASTRVSGRETVACFDLLVPSVGELIGGSVREERYDQLVHQMKHHQLNEKDYWWYLELRRYGSAPHGGFGMGFERLLKFVTGIANVRDLIAVPRGPHHLHF